MSKKLLFIDRDGTIILEPEDYQIDSIDKLEFYPNVLSQLRNIRQELDYRFVMVSNQDGLGSNTFPYEDFIAPHDIMLRVLKSEGIVFDEILIDKSIPTDQANTRKPRTGLVTHYIKSKQYDLDNSYVIGDRLSDIEFATNIGCKAIHLCDIKESNADLTTNSWVEIYRYLKQKPRIGKYHHKTNETNIHISLNLDGTGKADNQTGIAFFDHMLDQLAKHGGIDLKTIVDGDLEVDQHHTIEDTALALGHAFLDALGSKKGINRYGFLLPMDEALAQVAIDFSGRPYIVWDAEFKREKIGEMPTEMFYHFFKSFTDTSKCTLNIKVEGKNEHHKIEAIFKAFAKAIKMAIAKSDDDFSVPSTKGIL